MIQPDVQQEPNGERRVRGAKEVVDRKATDGRGGRGWGCCWQV